jgi:hypothetical protein
MLPLAALLPAPAGYKSVAHYLVLNNLSDEAKPVALERGMCPPELSGEAGRGAGSSSDSAAAVAQQLGRGPHCVGCFVRV